MKTALITGISGQDGAFLASQLIESGQKVVGTVRRGGNLKTGRLDYLGISDKVEIVPLEVSDLSNVIEVLKKFRPDYVYNLAAQSFVNDSFSHPALTMQINYFGALNILESIRLLDLDTSFFQASSSEIFGNSDLEEQDEETQLRPISPYAVSKCSAHLLVRGYRDTYGIHASSGILFNHESELRGRQFVTRKISSQLAEFKYGRREPIQLGNLDASRDWGYARDFTNGMQLVVESSLPGEYVFATNSSHSVRDFFKVCAVAAGFNPVFDGIGADEKCFDKATGLVLCEVNKKFFRKADVINPRGNPKKMHEAFQWKPTVSFNEMCNIMVNSDLKLLSKNKQIKF